MEANVFAHPPTEKKAAVCRTASLRGAIFATVCAILVGAGSASAQSISNVAATNVTNNSAVITWTTSLPSGSQVNYGITTGYGASSPANPTQVTAHSVTLTGLTPNTLYDFDVVSVNTSANFAFATLSTSPIIADLNVIYITSNSATINWTTDQPSTAVVNYGTTSNYTSSSSFFSTPSIAHAVTLNGLAPNTTYNFAVVSNVGSGPPSTSANQTFTTAPSATAPNISFVAAFGSTTTSATITWSTDVPANSVVAYGPTTALGQLAPVQTALSASHGVTLTGLDSGTTYYFVCESTGANGVTGYSFMSNVTTTGPPPVAPVISNVITSTPTSTSATITWTTDVPSNSLVNYGTTINFGLSALIRV
jgi:hypothetical protein